MYNFYLKYRLPGSTNMVNPDRVEQGRLTPVRGDDNYAMSDFIPVEPGLVYQGHSIRQQQTFGAFRFIFFYDLDKVRIGSLQEGVGGAELDFFTAPANCFYVKVTFPSITAGQDPELVGLTPGQGSPFMPYNRSRRVTPIYKKIDREYALEGDNRYYREKLKGSFKVTRLDYMFLEAAGFDQKITLVIVDLEGVLHNYVGYFYKTDCKWDADNQIVEISSVETDDNYEALLGGMDKKFNLIELAPQLQAIGLRRRPIIQVYIKGNTVLTNIQGGSYWEQTIDIDPVVDTNVLQNTYKFYKSKDESIISPSYFTQGVISTDITGKYVQAVREDGVYRLNSRTGTSNFIYGYYFEIARVSDGAVLYRSGATRFRIYLGEALFKGTWGDTGDTGEFYITEMEVYCRLYHDDEQINGVDGADPFLIPAQDIVPQNPNYRFIDPFPVFNFHPSSELQDEPTEFGQVPKGVPGEGLYYKQYLVPPEESAGTPIPISPSNWKDLSIWFFYDGWIRVREILNSEPYDLRDTYTLPSTLNVLLNAIGSTLNHFGSTAYSELLYSATNPLGAFTYIDFEFGMDLAYSEQMEFFIAPKSNIISGRYDRPALKAEITLGQVLKMLRDCFKIYWHVEGGTRLRLEHISWYQNGGSYTEPVIGTDLTVLTQLKNNLNWNFGQNKWEFDKASMPERYEFGWMDDVSRAFEGHPIQVLSNYVQKGRVEDNAVNGFTTDVDFITANPTEVSKDGFCLLGAVQIGETYQVPFTRNELGYNQPVIMQNGLLSWLSLHPKYHIYDKPSSRVNINQEDLTLHANNTKLKKQEVLYPGTIERIDPYKLIKTGLGNGLIDKLSINMESYMLSATIKHDTE